MKIRLLLALVLMTVNVFGQTIPSYVPTNGLVGWWPFNGNANDESGNGNNGTVNGATLTTDRNGATNSSFEFNGAGSIIIPHQNQYNMGSSFTISVWIMPTNYNQVSTIINKNDNSSGAFDYFNLGIIDNSWRIYSQFGDGSNIDTIVDTSAVILNQWAHLSLVVDSTVSLYINGNLLKSHFRNVNPLQNNLPISIGYWQTQQHTYFDGKIDDIGIWNRALSQQEITNLHNASTPNPCIIGSLPISVNQGLVAWYPFCGNAQDESGNGNNGTINGAILTNDRWGNSNSSYSFDGNSYISCGDDSALNFTNDFSMVLWGKTTVNYSNCGVLGRWNNAGPSHEHYLLWFNQDSVQACLGLPNTYAPTYFNYYDGNWHMYVVNYKSDSLSIYIDGFLKNKVYFAGNLNDQVQNLYIGAYSLTSVPPTSLWNGELDDIRIYNRALSDFEISSLYNEGLNFQTIAGSCDTLIFNANVTGFNPVTYANQIHVYPNPTRDNLVIDCGTNYTGLNGYSIRITNLLGQTVYNSPVTAQLTNIQLTPPTWVNGTYVVQFVHPNGTVVDTKRIIIQ